MVRDAWLEGFVFHSAVRAVQLREFAVVWINLFGSQDSGSGFIHLVLYMLSFLSCHGQP